ncbi:hypothetical protein [Polynucleobacter sp. AM-25C3]|uniref:hypothetical protein n=1 Tax=Polynucleobacter sp. AM-25C3 TaxID=1855569 RepID=UPI001C0D2E79|nr:hypothetical protein [Polynucleobacter sp. AM-25C3]MBU3602555.1 hypothetical protein [Polynucleobacter sp. AM-25C3]
MTAQLSRPNPSGWSAFFFYTSLTIGGIALFLGLAGCAAPLLALGSSTTAAASSVGTAAVSVAVANPSTAASAISTATTGKSPLEHAASAATKQDCNFLNALGSKPICVDIPIPAVKDMSEPYLGPADIAIPKAKQ